MTMKHFLLSYLPDISVMGYITLLDIDVLIKIAIGIVVAGLLVWSRIYDIKLKKQDMKNKKLDAELKMLDKKLKLKELSENDD